MPENIPPALLQAVAEEGRRLREELGIPPDDAGMKKLITIAFVRVHRQHKGVPSDA